MDEQLDRVRAAYDRDPEQEWRRLESGAQNRLEYLVTTYALERHLRHKEPPLRVLDAGGGPGRYTLFLAERGYRVTLLDLSPALLDLARARIAEAGSAVARNVEAVVEGSITDLDAFPDNSFDAALCLGGPLSHLVDPLSRQRAVAELRRVTRPSGALFLSVMNRIGAYRGIVQWWSPDWARKWFHYIRSTGIEDIGDGRAPAYFFLPEELVALLTEAGLTVERLYGCEGIGSHLQEDNLLAVMDDPVVWPAWRDVLLETCDHPNVAGSTRHLLAVAHRRT